VEVADVQPCRLRRTDAFLDPLTQLTRRLDVVGQDEELLRKEVGLRLEEPRDSLDDDACLPGASTRDDDERPIAMLDDRPLIVGQREVTALGGSRRRYRDDILSFKGRSMLGP
jgi:hypothetical protein